MNVRLVQILERKVAASGGYHACWLYTGGHIVPALLIKIEKIYKIRKVVCTYKALQDWHLASNRQLELLPQASGPLHLEQLHVREVSVT